MIEKGARVMLVESHEGAAEHQVNTALELIVGEKAHADHIKITSGAGGVVHVSSLMAAIGANARFNDFSYTTGGAVVRNQLFVRFDGEGTLANIRGATLLKGNQHADATLVADHVAGGCQCREVFKAVLDDKSRSVFQGKIIVRQGSQKTDAKMMTNSLLLSDEAEANQKPELEIFADDVQCGHGATSGALDENLKFYLMARGIPEVEAESLLVQAFVGDAVEGIEHAGLRDALMEDVVSWLRARGGQLMHPAVTNGSYDVARIRQDFPILSMQVYGKPLVYLDNAASAQKPQSVLDRIQQAYTSEYANVHRGLHYLANAATEGYEGAREKVRAFLNAPRLEEVIFTRNATEAINLVAYTFGRERIKPGDEIVLSILEHHSNIVPWHFLRERHGAVIKWAPVDEEGNFLIDEFEKLLTPRTKMVAITHMSNMTGTHVPVKEVVKRAHARNIPVLVDGSQAAVHLDVDVQDIGCDFYVFTGHKLYGPTGIGVLWGKYDLLAADAAVQRRRRDDPRGCRGPHHLWRAAAPLRGRHAADRAGDRARRRDRLRQFDRQAAHPRARDRPGDLRPRAAARDQLHPHLRHHQGQGADRVVRDEGRASPRRGDGDRPRRRRGARRNPLRDAAARPLWRDRHLPGLVCDVQHPRGNRSPRASLGQSAGSVLMTDEPNSDAPSPKSSRKPPSALPEAEIARLTDEIVAALKTVYDPEIPADIYELGLIYKIDIADDRSVKVDMTLTTPNCPSAQELPQMVENAVSSVAGVGKVDVAVVWDPPWDQSRMTDEARLVLNMW